MQSEGKKIIIFVIILNFLSCEQVKDRQVIKTTDAERVCVKPDGLQDIVNELVSKVPNGRSFVR